MKNIKFSILVTLVSLAFITSSCSVIGGIFKAGMGVGIFLVVLVIVIIAALVMRANKK